MTAPGPAEWIRKFASRWAGDAREWVGRKTAHGSSEVWEVGCERGVFFVKVYERKRKYEQEVKACGVWVRGMDAWEGRTPRLAATHEDDARGEWAGMYTAVRGERAEGCGLSAEEWRQMHRQAGEFLKGLHGLRVEDEDAVGLTEAIGARWEEWRTRAEAGGALSAEEMRWMSERAQDVKAFAGETRVACHRDFHPRNWMVEGRAGGEKRLGVIDFEHARLDAAMMDVVRLWAEEWPVRAGCEAAFWEGYGRMKSARDEAQLRVLGALHALATVTWAAQHRDDAFERKGREMMKRLMGG